MPHFRKYGPSFPHCSHANASKPRVASVEWTGIRPAVAPKNDVVVSCPAHPKTLTSSFIHCTRFRLDAFLTSGVRVSGLVLFFIHSLLILSCDVSYRHQAGIFTVCSPHATSDLVTSFRLFIGVNCVFPTHQQVLPSWLAKPPTSECVSPVAHYFSSGANINFLPVDSRIQIHHRKPATVHQGSPLRCKHSRVRRSLP